MQSSRAAGQGEEGSAGQGRNPNAPGEPLAVRLQRHAADVLRRPHHQLHAALDQRDRQLCEQGNMSIEAQAGKS